MYYTHTLTVHIIHTYIYNLYINGYDYLYMYYIGAPVLENLAIEATEVHTYICSYILYHIMYSGTSL